MITIPLIEREPPLPLHSIDGLWVRHFDVQENILSAISAVAFKNLLAYGFRIAVVCPMQEVHEIR